MLYYITLYSENGRKVKNEKAWVCHLSINIFIHHAPIVSRHEHAKLFPSKSINTIEGRRSNVSFDKDVRRLLYREISSMLVLTL